VRGTTLFLSGWAFSGGSGVSGAGFPLFLLSGLIGIGIGDAGLFQALPRLGSRLSLLIIQCLTAPIAALIEWLWLGTTLGGTEIIGALVILSGVGVALAPGEHLTIPRPQLITGSLFALIGAGGNAVGVVLSRKAYAVAHENQQTLDGGTAAFQRILGGLLIAGILLLIAKRVLRNNFRAAPHPGPLPIRWGEGGRRSGEGFTPFPPEIIYANHSNPQATAYFSKRRQPGVVLRVSRI
jgi:drug/metabolite transporter (DMT)-like permease